MREKIKIENLKKSFGSLEVLRGINLTIYEGDVVAMIGESGSGKSTLLRCINFLEIPSSGTIQIGGEVIVAHSSRKINVYRKELCKVRTRVGMVFQHFNLFPHKTALQNVMEGLTTVMKVAKPEARKIAKEQLALVGLESKGDEYPSRLSGGQKQRVAIARALAMKPEVMLFDEVTSALDPELVGEVLSTMRQLAEGGMTMICVTHELGFAYHVANRVVFLHDGVIEEEGESHTVLIKPQSARLKEFLSGHSAFSLPGEN